MRQYLFWILAGSAFVSADRQIIDLGDFFETEEALKKHSYGMISFVTNSPQSKKFYGVITEAKKLIDEQV